MAWRCGVEVVRLHMNLSETERVCIPPIPLSVSVGSPLVLLCSFRRGDIATVIGMLLSGSISEIVPSPLALPSACSRQGANLICMYLHTFLYVYIYMGHTRHSNQLVAERHRGFNPNHGELHHATGFHRIRWKHL